MSSIDGLTEQGYKVCEYWEMNTQNIIDAIKRPGGTRENHLFEFKACLYEIKSKRDVIDEISKTICAFLNTSGGVIIIGIGDKNKEILGIERDLKQKRKGNEDPQRTFGTIESQMLNRWQNNFRIGKKDDVYALKLARKYVSINMEEIINPETKEFKKIIIIKVRSKYISKDYGRLVLYKASGNEYHLPYSRHTGGKTKRIPPSEQVEYLEESLKERIEIESMDSNKHRQRHTKPRSKQDDTDIKQAKFVMSVSAVTIIIIITLMTLGNIGTNWIWLPVILALVTVAFFFPKNNR